MSDDIPPAAILAALEADAEWARKTHPVLSRPTGRDQVVAMLEAAAPIIAADAVATDREREGALRAELRSVIDGFFAYYGNSSSAYLEKARDLAEGMRQVLDRDKISDEGEAAR